MNIHTGIDNFVARLAARQQQVLGKPRNNSYMVPAYHDREVDELFPAPPEDPRVQKKGSRRLGGFKYTSYVFESAHEPLPDDYRDYYRNEQRALHRFPVGRVSSGKTRRAAIYIHGWNESNPIIDDAIVGPIAARGLGADIYHFRQAYHGPRKPDDPSPLGLSYFSADVVKMFEAIRQSVLDTRTILQWLLNSGKYDEVGVFGISLGGVISSLTVCAEHRFDFAVPMIGNLNISRLIMETPILANVRAELEAMGLSADFARESLRRGGLEDLMPRMPHENILFVAAEEDQLITAESMRDVINRWSGVRELWVRGGHMTGLPYIIRAMPEIRGHVDDMVWRRRRTEAMLRAEAPRTREAN